MNEIKEPLVVHDRRTLGRATQNSGIVGLVCSRGDFHPGHQAAFVEAASRVDTLVVSVYTDPVEPAFETTSDIISSADLQVAANAGVDIIFAPSTEAFYPFGAAQTLLNPGQVLNRFEGTNSREQMLRRLTQLVKMVGIVRPDKGFIGQCDAQFLACVRQVVRDLDIQVTIEVVPTFRDLDGVVVSREIQGISGVQREGAIGFAKALFAGVRQAAASGSGSEVLAACRQGLSACGGEIEYLDLVDPISFDTWTGEGPSTACLIAAAKLEGMRLCDNQLVVLSRP